VSAIASTMTVAATRWLVPNTMGTGPTITTPPASPLPSPALQRDSINMNMPRMMRTMPRRISSSTCRETCRFIYLSWAELYAHGL